ncbi:c-type cytochrome biogenesis protein CcmI [Maritimibacter sp. DP1N21-5]|uniref:c-type cytochrome biogenesis protein CcmI n=1 Tax=Maritimibacter sp. DP1N21-5 TaxID=2836867 RepID=UPI001C449C7B|nr:c-type cytochrome biogenesis protein CcmI [Maritimibacter sp. DP1N21-5]MBV7410048.1 c-type cytochrome biogenesis protein CcmI [Maritimibacter sp. DP1N21-5]
MGFWILAALAALVIVLSLGYALFAPARDTARATAEFDMKVYRDQLTELDRDVARGTVAPEDAERTRVEISRRLLEADRAAQVSTGASSAPRRANVLGAGAMALLVLGGGLWLYSDLGAPQYWDMPLQMRKEMAEERRATRPGQAEIEAQMPPWTGPAEDVDQDYIDLVTQLRTAVERRPGDVQGLTLLARHEAMLGNYKAAYAAQKRLVEVMGDTAAPSDHADLAELMIMAAGGYVSPEAEAALDAALKVNPNNEVARYYSGLMFAQNGRPDLAFRLWKVLYETSPVESPWMAPIAAQIEDLAQLAGVNYTLPDRTPSPGPTAEQMREALTLSDEDQQQMIRGMVDGLMERLATQGGSAEEFARLINALAVLGETEQAQAILDEARGSFANSPADLATVEAAGTAAGLTVPE